MLLRDIFRANLKYYRLKADISQEALAAKAGLHRTYISSVERGLRNISIDNIDRIANDCRSLETIDFTGITFKIKYAQYAFMDCRVLREIKGAVFDFADLEDINNIQDMFKYCNSLNGVKVKNIPNNNKTKFEQVTGLSSSQYTVVS